MKARAPQLLCVLCFLCLLCLPARADELRLRDGTKIVGTIVGFEDNSFKVETSYGFALVRKDKVASIILAEAKPDAKKELPAEAKKSAPPAKALEQPIRASGETPAPAPAPAPKPAPPPTPAPPVRVAPEPMRESVEGNSYINHTYGFRMYKPPSWQVIEGAQKTLATAVVAMGTSDETTILVVGREPLRGSLEGHAATTERRLREMYENYRPLGEARTIVAGLPATQRRFRGTIGEHDWSGLILSVSRGTELYTILGMTYADSDLIQIQENVIAKTISSLEFLK